MPIDWLRWSLRHPLMASVWVWLLEVRGRSDWVYYLTHDA